MEMTSIKCYKCGGSGYLEHFKHRDNGICYPCNGKGFIEKWVLKKANIYSIPMNYFHNKKDTNDQIIKIIELVLKNEELEKESIEAKRNDNFEYAAIIDLEIAQNMTKIHKLRKEAGY